MARRYLFVCNHCSAAVESETERLPDGWLIISAVGERRQPGPPLRLHQLDLCSAACALDMIARAPELAMVARAPLLPDPRATAQLRPVDIRGDE